jgi:hypothetical protein
LAIYFIREDTDFVRKKHYFSPIKGISGSVGGKKNERPQVLFLGHLNKRGDRENLWPYVS